MLSSRSLAIVAVASVALVACRGKKEPPAVTPVPTNPTPTRDTMQERIDREARVRADSVGRAQAAAEAATREATAVRARVRAAVEEMVFFDYDQSSIRDDARAVLSRKVQILRDNPGVTVRIEGHADERGSVEYNLALSLRRANSIRDYLTSLGVDGSRFEVIPMGEERPLSTGTSEETYQQNRRGEFHITRGADTLK